MPVRRKADKRSAGGDPWAEIFEFGSDLLHRAQWLSGVRVNDRLEPDHEEVREAWHRYGADFLAGYDGKSTPWAMDEFGPPGGRNAR